MNNDDTTDAITIIGTGLYDRLSVFVLVDDGDSDGGSGKRSS